MATQFLGTRYQSFKNDGTVNAAGWVYFYEAGTATEKTTYSDSDLETANASPVVLNSAGCADIWYTGDADASVYDSTGTLIDSYSNINPAEASTANEANLIINGSFENGTSTVDPDGWVRAVPYSGGTSVQDTDANHGTYSWKFISAGSGGGILTSESFFNVTTEIPVLVSWTMKSSAADVRNVIEILWYDSSDAYISATTIYDDSTTNPTSWTDKYYLATPVATATRAKLRVTGCHSSDATSGTVRFDNFTVTQAGFLFADLTFTGTNTHTGLESFAKTKFSTALGANYLNNVAFSAGVGTNALTFTLLGEDLAAPSATNPVQVSFRSATLTTGGSTVRTATAATTVVAPSGATLGFIANEASYVYLYALDNAGTIELAVSGNPQDTSGVVSTTAIGTGSDTKGTIYSTSARTNVACRYLGKILITTGATPGEWGSAPTSIHGVNETPPMWSVGYGQTWQNVVGSRALDTTYTNSTGKPIMVSVTVGVLITETASLVVGGVTVGLTSNSTGGGFHTVPLVAIVPPGATYSLATSGAVDLSGWAELR